MQTINTLSRFLGKPKDSPEHQQLRDELWLVGREHACRYYLSILTGRDFFAASQQQFIDGLGAYIKEHANADAARYCDGPEAFSYVQFFLPYVKRQCDRSEGIHDERRLSKQDRALIMLVEHPDWTDEQIRQALRTTAKQMKRWSGFNYARTLQTRAKSTASRSPP